MLLEPLVYRDSSRLVMVQTVLEESGTRIGGSPPDFYRLREKNRSFEGVAALYPQPLNLTARRSRSACGPYTSRPIYCPSWEWSPRSAAASRPMTRSGARSRWP